MSRSLWGYFIRAPFGGGGEELDSDWDELVVAFATNHWHGEHAGSYAGGACAVYRPPSARLKITFAT
jgi:hypothetical protein